MREDVQYEGQDGRAKMKLLYCYTYGILGGVCTQLINRLKVFEPTEELEELIELELLLTAESPEPSAGTRACISSPMLRVFNGSRPPAASMPQL